MTQVEQLAGRLAAYEIFRTMEEDLRREVCSVVEFIPAPAGSTLFRQGDPVCFCYVVVKGSVSFTKEQDDGEAVEMGVKGPGASWHATRAPARCDGAWGAPHSSWAALVLHMFWLARRFRVCWVRSGWWRPATASVHHPQPDQLAKAPASPPSTLPAGKSPASWPQNLPAGKSPCELALNLASWQNPASWPQNLPAGKSPCELALNLASWQKPCKLAPKPASWQKPCELALIPANWQTPCELALNPASWQKPCELAPKPCQLVPNPASWLQTLPA
eukprot:296275-Chlamydomonas_euryale.AAC.1